MKMEPDVPGYHQDPVARGVLVAMAEDRLPDLRLGYLPLGFFPVKFGHLYFASQSISLRNRRPSILPTDDYLKPNTFQRLRRSVASSGARLSNCSLCAQ